jgi:hypothetical protein
MEWNNVSDRLKSSYLKKIKKCSWNETMHVHSAQSIVDNTKYLQVRQMMNDRWNRWQSTKLTYDLSSSSFQLQYIQVRTWLSMYSIILYWYQVLVRGKVQYHTGTLVRTLDSESYLLQSTWYLLVLGPVVPRPTRSRWRDPRPDAKLYHRGRLSINHVQLLTRSWAWSPTDKPESIWITCCCWREPSQ